MIKTFLRYVSVGLVNTIIHWIVFWTILLIFESSQALSNLIAFCVAVTFSFFANSKWTFNSEPTHLRYILFISFMGIIAGATGYIADRVNIPPFFMLILFSSASLALGFIYSNYIVFKE